MYKIKPILPAQDKNIADIIVNVGKEYGAIGEGFGPSDPEVMSMSQYYNDARSCQYLVATLNEEIVGGCGIAAFNQSLEISELRKLFLLPASRGMGIGKALTIECLRFAQNSGYKQCYLDTLKNMTSAISLYEKLGFKHLHSPLEGTIHNGCDVWMLKALSNHV